MKLNVAHKIFGIACVVLTFMLMVAVYSINLTAVISDELETVVHKHLPVADAVSRVNVHILAQGLVLQRLFVSGKPETTGRAEFVKTGDLIKAELTKILALLNTERMTLAHHVKAISGLIEDVVGVEREFFAYENHGLKLLAAHEAGDTQSFEALFKGLNAREDAIDKEIAEVRLRVEKVTIDAVHRTAKNEQFLLVINSTLTAIAALLGLGIAALITRSIVRNVRNLVSGTEAVEGGNLDTEVAVTTSDEIGKLGQSFNHMVGELRMKERIKETFGKYMDPRIVANLLDNPEFTEPGGERREMTVMFIDLKGFTSISEKLAPVDLVEMINTFFGHMTDAISQNGGVVDKFMGDAVMAYWGPPFTSPDEHASLACKAATEALGRLETFRSDVHRKIGQDADTLDIDLRIGISSGEMIVGTIGSTASMSFTVMGDPVNLGSRLEGANKQYGSRILISEQTRQLAGETIAARELDMIRVKGKEKPVRVFEVQSGRVDNSTFSGALTAYRSQDWDSADAKFRQLQNDPVAEAYIQRISHLRSETLAADWDGVWTFETK